MNVEFHSLYWDNVDINLVHAHKKVMEHFNIDMKYSAINMNHGQWLDKILTSATADVVVIIEPDCIPLNRECIDRFIKYAYDHETFVGIAQVSNHIAPAIHIYAAPAMLVISVQGYRNLGSPSCVDTEYYDAAELLSYKAESNGLLYKVLMPTSFEKIPSNGLVWRIGALAAYGIGTVFDNCVYHLYESRKSLNVKLFTERCNEVIAGTFSCSQFLPSNGLDYQASSLPICNSSRRWRIKRALHFIKHKIIGL